MTAPALFHLVVLFTHDYPVLAGQGGVNGTNCVFYSLQVSESKEEMNDEKAFSYQTLTACDRCDLAGSTLNTDACSHAGISGRESAPPSAFVFQSKMGSLPGF